MRLRTKFALVMTSLVFFVIAVLSYVFVAQLLDQLIQETDKRARPGPASFAPSQAFPCGSCTAGLAPGFRCSQRNPQLRAACVRNQRGLASATGRRQEKPADLRSLHHRYRLLGAGFNRAEGFGNPCGLPLRKCCGFSECLNDAQAKHPQGSTDASSFQSAAV